MLGRQLTGVERDRDDLALGIRTSTRRPTSRGSSEESLRSTLHVGLRRHPQHDPTVQIWPRLGRRPQALAVALQPVDRALAQGAVPA